MGKERDYVDKLGHSQALAILHDLCKDKALKARITKMAKEILAEVSSDSVAEQVFDALNSIAVEDLWDNSGKTRYGYNEITEVAHEMAEDAISAMVAKMEECRKLGLQETEKNYCVGIIAGLLKYGDEGNNEFHEYVPDDPYEIADDVFYEWKKLYPEDVSDIQAMFDGFMAG